LFNRKAAALTATPRVVGYDYRRGGSGDMSYTRLRPAGFSIVPHAGTPAVKTSLWRHFD